MKPGNAKYAFTLIELLVVIAIIGVLASLLLTSLAKAKTKGGTVACLSKQRQWHMGATGYADDDDNHWLPREDGVNSVNSWLVAFNQTNVDVWYNGAAVQAGAVPLKDYAASPGTQPGFYGQNIFTCPAARFGPDKDLNPAFSIAINSKLMDLNPRIQLTDIQEPTRTPLFLECGVPGETRFHGDQTPYNGQPKAFASRFSARHGGAGNLVFADGHAKTYLGEKVVETDDNSSTTGRNIIGGEILWWTDGHN